MKIDHLATQRQSSSNVGKLLSRILTKHLKKDRNITIKKLIEWNVWSSMLKVASKFE